MEESQYILPTLYHIDAKGQERSWEVWSEGNIMYSRAGVVEGKLQTQERSFKAVNVGKKNEISGEEKARNNTDLKWAKQLDKGYKPKSKKGIALYEKIRKQKGEQGGSNRDMSKSTRGEKGTKNNQVDDHTFKGDISPYFHEPMLACQKVFCEEDKVLKYYDFDEGEYIQWKLDGAHCQFFIIFDEDESHTEVLASRTGKQFPFLNHIRKDGYKLLAKNNGGKYKTYALVGELYNHEMYLEDVLLDKAPRFQLISSICKVNRKKPHTEEGQMKLYVFDIIAEGNQTQRNKLLDKIFDGYEGAILRSKKLPYESKRSLMMRKVKSTEEDEYEIVGSKKDPGVADYHFVFICKVDEEHTVDVKMKATEEYRTKMYKNRHKYVGKLLTVIMQEKSEDGIPRFPRGKSIRDYE